MVDISKLLYLSTKNYLKRGSLSGSAVLNTSSTTTLNINHNLGYIPQIYVAAEIDSSEQVIWQNGKVSELSYQGILSGLFSPPTYPELLYWTTENTLTIELQNTSGQSIRVYYLIYLDYDS